jgi:hypothetical protein
MKEIPKKKINSRRFKKTETTQHTKKWTNKENNFTIQQLKKYQRRGQGQQGLKFDKKEKRLRYLVENISLKTPVALHKCKYSQKKSTKLQSNRRDRKTIKCI